MKLVAFLVRGLIALIQAMPLELVARVGRAAGGLAWFVDVRHRRVALDNLALAFPETPHRERLALARENFRRIGENYLCALKTAAMTNASLERRLRWVGAREILSRTPGSLLVAVGHFGNFELFARAGSLAPGWGVATTYRALRQPALDRVLQDLRNRSGARYFERRSQGGALRETMRQGKVILGLLGDQHAGDGGLWLPFFGRDASCSAAPAIFALRYDTPLCMAICFREGLARWRVEVTAEIPTKDATGEPRTPEAITLDVNRAYEDAIRRDPANWFWVHRRWKPMSPRQKARLAQAGGEAAAGATTGEDEA